MEVRSHVWFSLPRCHHFSAALSCLSGFSPASRKTEEALHVHFTDMPMQAPWTPFSRWFMASVASVLDTFPSHQVSEGGHRRRPFFSVLLCLWDVTNSLIQHSGLIVATTNMVPRAYSEVKRRHITRARYALPTCRRAEGCWHDPNGRSTGTKPKQINVLPAIEEWHPSTCCILANFLMGKTNCKGIKLVPHK